MNVPQKHNLNALIVGTGEFRFCRNAISATDTKLKGWRDFGNIVALTPETDVKLEEHEGSYRGRKIVDRKFATAEKLEYVLTCDEWTRKNLEMLFMGEETTDKTQISHVAHEGDSLAFTMGSPSDKVLWYDVYSGGNLIVDMTSLVIAVAPAASVTADASTDKITETGHGRANGDPVVVGGTAVPTGLTAGVVYYIVAAATNDYKLAATLGGAAIDLTGTGTAVTIRKVLVQETDYTVDPKNGSVRFLISQTATVYPIITAPAIAQGDAGYFMGIIPMQETEQVGYGELFIYDQDEGNAVVLRHRQFSCVITAEKSKAVDGKKVGEFDVRVSVTADPGTLWVREDNIEPS